MHTEAMVGVSGSNTDREGIYKSITSGNYWKLAREEVMILYPRDTETTMVNNKGMECRKEYIMKGIRSYIWAFNISMDIYIGGIMYKETHIAGVTMNNKS